MGSGRAPEGTAEVLDKLVLVSSLGLALVLALGVTIVLPPT
jgi:hypothetical protein